MYLRNLFLLGKSFPLDFLSAGFLVGQEYFNSLSEVMKTTRILQYILYRS